jgi:hypothetical protein
MEGPYTHKTYGTSKNVRVKRKKCTRRIPGSKKPAGEGGLMACRYLQGQGG